MHAKRAHIELRTAFNNYQYGDFKPYLLNSTDRGNSWTSMASNLPDRHPVWCVVEDYANKDLLFVGTEFGLFSTVYGGQQWTHCRRLGRIADDRHSRAGELLEIMDECCDSIKQGGEKSCVRGAALALRNDQVHLRRQ
jgi:hypothetical protein